MVVNSYSLRLIIVVSLFQFGGRSADLTAAGPPQPKKIPTRLVWSIPNSGAEGVPILYKHYVISGSFEEQDRNRAFGVVRMHRLHDGKLVWKKIHPKMDDRYNDIPTMGINGRLWIEKDYLYYQANNGELVCVDLVESIQKETCCVVWSVDLVKAYSVYKRESSDIGNPQPGPVVDSGTVFVCTGNGSSFGLKENVVPKPDSPSFMAFDSNSGQLKWSSNVPGKRIMYGQWASPVIYADGKEKSVLFCGGDGLIYRFDLNGKQLMALDVNLPESKPWTKEEIGERVFSCMEPAIAGTKIYVSMSQGPDTRRNNNTFIAAIDLMNKVVEWRYMFEDRGDRLMSTPVVHDGVLYAQRSWGTVHAIDVIDGKEIWSVKLPESDNASHFGRLLFADGFIWASGQGDNYRLRCGRQKSSIEYIGEPGDSKIEDRGDIRGTPIVRGNLMIRYTSNYLECLKLP